MTIRSGNSIILNKVEILLEKSFLAFKNVSRETENGVPRETLMKRGKNV